MMSNLQILAQFVTSLHRMSSEMMSIGVDHVVFPVEEVEKLSMIPRAQRAAKYMTAMGLWRPPSGPGAPRPLPASTCCSGIMDNVSVICASKEMTVTSARAVNNYLHNCRFLNECFESTTHFNHIFCTACL